MKTAQHESLYFDGQLAREGDKITGAGVGDCRIIKLDGHYGRLVNIWTREEMETWDMTGDCREWDLLSRAASDFSLNA